MANLSKDQKEQFEKKRESEKMSSLFNNRRAQHAYYDKVNTLRAESTVIKNLLEVNLLKIAIETLTNEHSAL